MRSEDINCMAHLAILSTHIHTVQVNNYHGRTWNSGTATASSHNLHAQCPACKNDRYYDDGTKATTKKKIL